MGATQLAGCALCIATLNNLFAADWPQWRGLNRDGISSENVEPWAANGPPTLWRASVGTGFSSISVSAGRAYTMGNATDQDTVWCFDALTGKELWKFIYPSKLGPVYYEGGPGSTPTASGDQVFTIAKWGKVFCFDAARGGVLWQHDLADDGIKSNRWGFAGSPLVWHDLVILNAGAAGTALDRKTGKLVWSNGKEPTGYASPVLCKFGRTDCVLIFAAKALVALDPLTGRELWRQAWETGWDTNNTDPIPYRDHVFISSFTHGCALLSLDGSSPRVSYEKTTLYCNLSPGILQGHYLCAFNGEAKQTNDFRCIDLDNGDVQWSRKDPAFGSVISASGRLLILTEKGELLLAEATAADLRILARAQVLGGLCWTPPALAHGRLYARNSRGDLVCLDLGSAKR